MWSLHTGCCAVQCSGLHMSRLSVYNGSDGRLTFTGRKEVTNNRNRLNLILEEHNKKKNKNILGKTLPCFLIIVIWGTGGSFSRPHFLHISLPR